MSPPPALGMFGLSSPAVPFTAGPSFQQVVMGQIASASSIAESEKPLRARSPPLQKLVSSTSSQLSGDADESDQDLSSKSYIDYGASLARTKRKKMMTQSSLLSLPKNNASHDLAFFLRTTGPTASIRKESQTLPGRAASASRNAFRFLRAGSKRHASDVQDAHKNLNRVLFDEGGLLLPHGVQQKISSTGKKYLELAPVTIGHQDSPLSQPNKRAAQGVGSTNELGVDPATEGTSCLSSAESAIGLNTLEPRVSVFYAEDLKTDHGSIAEFYCSYGDGGRTSPVSPISLHLSPAKPGAECFDKEHDPRHLHYSPSPIRPPASDPPTPPPESAVSLSESYKSDLMKHPAERPLSSDEDALPSAPQPALSIPRNPVTPMPSLALPHEEFPVKLPRIDRESELKHPSPRRFASHSFLLEQTVSGASSADSPAGPEAPETPPPKSPLRMKCDMRGIEQVLDPAEPRAKPAPKLAPPVADNAQIAGRSNTIVPTVTTECVGPLTRSTQYKYTPVHHSLYPMSRKEREEKTRARKLRDRPRSGRSVDTVVCVPSLTPRPILTPRQRLRKARPNIQLSNLIPAPLSTRTTSITASEHGLRYNSDTTHSISSTYSSQRPLGEPSSQDVQTSMAGTVTPSKSLDRLSIESKLDSSPVTLMAAEIALPKAKSSPRATRIAVSNQRVYTPRPRSASMPRLSGKRFSRASCCEVPRPSTPEGRSPEQEMAPPLPSPPPNRALPPTPPASGSEGLRRKQPKTTSSLRKSPQHEMPPRPSYEAWPPQFVFGKTKHRFNAANVGSSTIFPADGGEDGIFARLDALEKHTLSVEQQNESLAKQNRMLAAALEAVLITNGASNAPLSKFLEDNAKTSMTWESRVTRRSEASHAASSSNGSALDMYMNTRTGAQVSPR